MSTGKLIPSTQRADGTWRKERRVKVDYVPLYKVRDKDMRQLLAAELRKVREKKEKARSKATFKDATGNSAQQISKLGCNKLHHSTSIDAGSKGCQIVAYNMPKKPLVLHATAGLRLHLVDGINQLSFSSTDPKQLIKFVRLGLRAAYPAKLVSKKLVPEDKTVLKIRSEVMQSFRAQFFERGFNEVTLVQIQIEAGSTIFKMQYFGEDAYLTQSSYLETSLPALGDVISIAQSYRAEDRLEVLLTHVVDRVLKSPCNYLVAELNPMPYMLRCVENQCLTESVDILLPNLDDIVGDSKIPSTDLMKNYECEGIDSKPNYWYKDQRVYGTMLQSRYGVGLKRVLCWLLSRCKP